MHQCIKCIIHVTVLLDVMVVHSASNMFVSRGIPSFAELLRKSIYQFKK